MLLESSLNFVMFPHPFLNVHSISCVKAADTEAVRGQRGSAKLRVEAFVTLRILVAKVIVQH